MEDIKSLEHRIGIKFKNKDLLKLALTHSSYNFDIPNNDINNERLEFLGDAILEFCITNNLFHFMKNEREGKMTVCRSYLVGAENLSKIALEINLYDYVLLGKGEEIAGGKKRLHLLADVIEAVIGAIYLDSGIESAKKFVDKFIWPKINDIDINDDLMYIDAKSELQDLIQKKYKFTPTYHLLEETGPDHDKKFVMSVRINDVFVADGTGTNKKMAEKNAAQNALIKIKKGFDI